MEPWLGLINHFFFGHRSNATRHWKQRALFFILIVVKKALSVCKYFGVFRTPGGGVPGEGQGLLGVIPLWATSTLQSEMSLLGIL